jgi:hypothetical protein
MSLSDELIHLTKIHHNVKQYCKIQEFLDSSLFTDEDRETFRLVMENRSVYTSKIMPLLRKRGLNASEATMNRHRRFVCSCYVNAAYEVE